MVEVLDPGLQAAITEVRTSGLNIMMSMKEEGKPVSFVEDCAVPLEHLAEYTARADRGVREARHPRHLVCACRCGCLHVRPVLNLRLDKDVKAMRAIAEEAFAMVRDYKGSHSGEHGDGIVRSEFHELMFGKQTRARVRTGEGRASIRTACSIRARSCARRNSTTGSNFRFKPGLSRRGHHDASSTGRPGRAPAAVSRARSRCATTTAPAARSTAA